MIDSIELSTKLVGIDHDFDSYSEVLRAYEAEMIPRATEAVEDSRGAWWNLNLAAPRR